jgi:uncharacterized protein (DUF302 family)
MRAVALRIQQSISKVFDNGNGYRKEPTMTTPYGFGTTLPVSYEEAIPRVKEALKAEGFGVLTEIDVRRTMHEKLGAEMEPYIILGACNPPLAHRALEQELDIGLLLPCNVVVRAEGKGSRVEVADPQAMLGIVGNEELNTVADEAKRRLQRVVASLGGQA